MQSTVHYHNAPGSPVAVTAALPLPVSLTTITPAAPLSVTLATTPSAGSKSAFVRGIKAPAAIAVPEALAGAGTYVRAVTIYAGRAARVANAATVWIDAIATNDAQQVPLAVGGAITFTAPPGMVIDLGDLYVDAGTLTDGVYWLGLL